jgi:TP901 family phage tail tape measure protein
MPDLSLVVSIVGKNLLSGPADEAKRSLTGLAGAADAAKTLFPGVAVAAAGMTAALASTVKTAADFEATMSGVKAVMSPAEVNQFGSSLEKLALQLGKDTAFSAKEAASGIEELIKGGLSAQDVLGGAAKSTLALAAAGGVALPDAAKIAANALAQFNLQGSDMARVADLIAGAANASAIDVGDFKFSLQAAGAVASTVGFSLDDLAGAIAVMGKAGIAGSDAGTSLKTMMLNLQPSTKAQVEEFKRLGLVTEEGANAFFTAEGRVRSMAEVAGILQTAMAGMTEQQRTASLEILFGSDAIRAGAVLAKEGAAGFDAMAAAMGKVTAETVGAARLDNLSGSLKQLGGSLETVQIELGQKLIPLFRPLVDGATRAINAFLSLSDEWKTAIAVGGLVVTGLTAIAAAGLGLIAILPTLTAGFAAAGTIAATVAGVFTGPVVLAIGAVVAAGVLLTKAWTENWGDIQGKTAAAWKFLDEHVFTPLGKELARFADVVLPELLKAWESVSDNIRRAWGALQRWLEPAMTALATFIEENWETIARVVDAAWDVMTLGVRVAWEVFQGIILAGLKVLQGDWRGAWDTMKEHLGRAWQQIDATVGTWLGILAEGMAAAWAGIRGVAAAAWQGIQDAIAGAVAGLVGWLSDRWNDIRATAAGAWAAVAGAIVGAFNGIIAPIQATIDRVLGLLRPVQAAIAAVVNFRPPDIPQVFQSVQLNTGGGGGTPALKPGEIDWGKVNFEANAAKAHADNVARAAKRALGGPVAEGMPYIVGDGGRPELFVPQQDGYILPRVPSGAGYAMAGAGAAAVRQPLVVNLQLDGQTVAQHTMNLLLHAGTGGRLRMDFEQAVVNATLQYTRRNGMSSLWWRG